MEAPRDMHRWLGDGGMPIIGLVGAAFTGYGVDGEDLGWVVGTFTPAELACNPAGVTQAGIHSLLLDASMNFAINAALPRGARTRGTLEMKTECMRPALKGAGFALRGEVVRLARQVAYGEATLRDDHGALVSRATGTFLLHRPDPPSVSPPPDQLGSEPLATGVCLVCCGPAAARSRVCFACRRVGHRLGAPLTPVLPAYLCPVPGPLYGVLLGYKEAPVAEARRHFARLVRALFAELLADHAACVAAAVGGVPDLVIPVPSTRRPGNAALSRVEGLAADMAARLGGASWDPEALARGGTLIGHMAPHPDGFVVPPSERPRVAGHRVALIDDVYVSGARAQSSAAALRRAGASAVVIVVLGRVLRPGRVARHARFLACLEEASASASRRGAGADLCGRCVRPQAGVSTE